jgi:anti-sigma factor ChrR (cupin superfamily)
MAANGSAEGSIHIADITAASEDWRDLAPGIQMRVLRTCQATGTWVVLYKVKAGTTASPHKHFGSADSFVIEGKMIAGGKGGRTLHAGDYAYEPNNQRVHEATYFEEDTLHLYIHTGPMMYLDEAGNPQSIVDWATMRRFAETAA